MFAETIARLRGELDRQLADLLPEDRRFVLLDFPDYTNVGDNALYLGALELLRAHGRRPAYTSEIRRIDWDAVAAVDGPIFLIGGGNFGDLYDWAQAFREEVLDRFPRRPVVQLPQTINFRSAARLSQAARAIERHGAFTLLVRDQPSAALARQHFGCEVRLCPDTAFALGALHRGRAVHSLLLHLREDDEAAQVHDDTALAAEVDLIRADWPPDPPGFHTMVKRRRALTYLMRRFTAGPHVARANVLEAYARARLGRGTALLSSARTVITDRLHGHILCVLLGIPHLVLDNKHGKIGAFMTQWATEGAGAHRIMSLQEAPDALSRIGNEAVDRLL